MAAARGPLSSAPQLDAALVHRFSVAIQRAGTKEVLQLARCGSILLARFDLGAEGPDGNALDLAVAHKRYDLAMRLLRLGVVPVAAAAATSAACGREAAADLHTGEDVVTKEGDVFGDVDVDLDLVHATAESPAPPPETPEPLDGVTAETPGPPPAADSPEVEELPECAEAARQLAPNCRRALAWAARDGKADFLTTLLQCGAPASQSNAAKCSALQLAAGRGKVQCVLALLSAGAWALEENKAQVQHWLAHFKLGPALGEVAADVMPQPTEEDLAREAQAAAVAERARAAEANAAALAAAADAEKEKESLKTRLQFAIMRQGTSEVKALLQKGAPLCADYDLDECGHVTGTALELAIRHKRFDLAQHLLLCREGAGKELARSSRRALALAAQDGRLPLVEALLQFGARSEPDEYGETALWLAATHGQAACTRALLAAGAMAAETKVEEVRFYLNKWHVEEPGLAN